MQGVVEDLIRLLGYLTLQVGTLGRYGRIRPADSLLLEGTVGFLLLAVTAYTFYKVIA